MVSPSRSFGEKTEPELQRGLRGRAQAGTAFAGAGRALAPAPPPRPEASGHSTVLGISVVPRPFSQPPPFRPLAAGRRAGREGRRGRVPGGDCCWHGGVERRDTQRPPTEPTVCSGRGRVSGIQNWNTRSPGAPPSEAGGGVGMGVRLEDVRPRGLQMSGWRRCGMGAICCGEMWVPQAEGMR